MAGVTYVHDSELSNLITAMEERTGGPWFVSDMECTRCGERWVLAHQGAQERYHCPNCKWLEQWPPTAQKET